METAASFRVGVTREAIAGVKAAGNANNDWVVTHRLLRDAGLDVGLEEVTRRFEELYNGSDKQPGLQSSRSD